MVVLTSESTHKISAFWGAPLSTQHNATSRLHRHPKDEHQARKGCQEKQLSHNVPRESFGLHRFETHVNIVQS